MIRRTPIWNTVHAVSRITAAILWDLKVWHTEYVPTRGPAILITNHQSFLDPVMVALRLYRPVSYFARSDLFNNPAFAWFIRSLNAFPVRRGEADIGALREALRCLEDGNLLCFFPEGHRTSDGEIGPIQKGVTLLIRKSGAPVIPVVIDGSFDALPRHRWVQDKPVRVLFGPHLDVHGRGADQITQTIDVTFRSMQARLRAWQALARKGYHPPPP